jgi:ERCC4-type nuclease
MTPAIPPIVIDTREKNPWDFNHPTIIKTLKTADYSIEGMENQIVVEKKGHEEFVNCLSNDRDRFLREIERGKDLKRLHIVVEGSFMGVLQGLYENFPSAMHPNAIRGTIAAWENRYDWVRFWFPGDRETAQGWTEHLLKRSWQDLNEGKIEGSKQENAG